MTLWAAERPALDLRTAGRLDQHARIDLHQDRDDRCRTLQRQFRSHLEQHHTTGTSQKLDGIPQVVMNVPQYRNFGSYQTIVCCHTVNVDGSGHAGIRWYELRRTSGTWSVRQQGTYAPDVHNRWMGSVMLNGMQQDRFRVF